MATITAPQAAASSYTITLTSLNNVTYVASSAVDTSSTDPLDILIEVTLKSGTVSGNKQAKVFVQASLDASTYESGPTSGTTTTDEPNLHFIGVVPLLSNSTTQVKIFSMMASLGFIPYAHKLIVFNDSGATTDASTGSARYALVTGVSA